MPTMLQQGLLDHASLNIPVKSESRATSENEALARVVEDDPGRNRTPSPLEVPLRAGQAASETRHRRAEQLVATPRGRTAEIGIGHRWTADAPAHVPRLRELRRLGLHDPTTAISEAANGEMGYNQ